MHERVSVNQICFLGEPLRQVADVWLDIGAKRVSFVNQALLEELPAVEALLQSGAHEAETITHTFLAGRRYPVDAETVAAARERLARLIGAASRIGAKSIYMVAGGRGTETWEEAAEAFCEAIAPCVSLAREAGIPLLIENAPSVYADLHLAHTLRDTILLAEMADIGVCIDLPGCWTEAGLKQLIERAAPRCALVQVGDYVLGDRAFPCRAVPGDGAAPLRRLFDWILNAGYEGAFDLELLGPRIEQEGRVNAVRRAADAVSEMLVGLGA